MSNYDKIEPVALALSKLIAHCPELDSHCQEAIKRADTDAVLALGIKALQLRDSRRYFEYVEELSPNKYLFPTSVEMSARFWGAASGEFIATSLLSVFDFGYGEGELRRIWSLWCKRQKNLNLFNISQRLIGYIKDNASLEKAYTILFDECLAEMSSRPPAERRKYLIHIKQLKNEVGELASRNLFRSANKLVKWVAYFYCPEIVSKDDSWVVNVKGSFGIPKKPNDPLLVAQIFEKIRSVYPMFELASIGEIRSLSLPDEGFSELIRDHFPRDFSYNDKEVLPVNLVAWDGRVDAKDFIRKDKLAESRVAWRPRFNLQADSSQG